MYASNHLLTLQPLARQHIPKQSCDDACTQGTTQKHYQFTGSPTCYETTLPMFGLFMTTRRLTATVSSILPRAWQSAATMNSILCLTMLDHQQHDLLGS